MVAVKVRFTRTKPFRHRIWTPGSETYVTMAELDDIRTAVEICDVTEGVPALPDTSSDDATGLERVGIKDRLQRLVTGPWRPRWNR